MSHISGHYTVLLKPIVLMHYWLKFGVDIIVKIAVKGKALYGTGREALP